jgi:tripartite-type tricarboxylate transporter receptor subunit TctC
MTKRTWITRILCCICLSSAGATLAQPAESAAAYPSRQIRLIVPYAAGGGVDTVMRQLAPRLSTLLGQQVIIDNKPGGATVIATDAVAKARPDGYTLLATGAPISINQALRMQLPYDVLRDLEPISLVVTLPGLIMVHPSVPAKSLKQLVELAKSKPGGLSFGSAGIGSIGHLGGALLCAKAGISMQHIGYKGSAPATTDLVGGQIPVLVDAIIPSGAQVKAGRAVALAIASKRRSPLFPDVPTTAEAGYPDVLFGGTFGLMAPAHTPPAIIAKFHQALIAAIDTPGMRKQLTDLGYEIVADSPAEYGAFIRSEIDTWSKIVQANDIKPE